MSAALGQLRTLKAEISAFGSLPLLPTDDLVEYAACCEEVFGLADDLLARAPREDAEDLAQCLLELGQAMRRAGDTLTGAEILVGAARFAERAGLERIASNAHNSAGVAFYLIGDFEDSYEALGRAMACLGDDEYGAFRSLMVRLNLGNLYHLDSRFEDAERTFLELSRDLEAIAPDLVARYGRHERDALVGGVLNNLAANRCWWAQRELAHGLPVHHHVALAEDYLAQALARPLPETYRVETSINQAHALNLRAEPDRALAILESLVDACSRDRELMHHLPEIYRFGAEARALQGDTDRALRNCYRALESSLTVANYLEERRIVDTFVAVAHLSNVLLAGGEDPARDAAKFAGASGELVSHLVDFLERKDWYTGHNHSKSVATLSLRIARALCASDGAEGGTARAEISEDMLHLAGMLHDIGKLALPWSLLNKIIPLTARERELVRTHAQRGEEILLDVGMPGIGALVAEHHERPDGSGYPRGKRDSSIMGAILAVADVFEAMTTVNRRYRTPKSLESAVREVVAMGGTQFDARVANALATVFSHKL